MPLAVGVLKETLKGETRVALTPEVSGKLQKLGAKILMERGAGEGSQLLDSEYPGVEFTDAAGVPKPHLAEVRAFAELLEANGIGGVLRSIGSTPTVSALENFGGVDEIRPGNYVFFDAFQAAIGSCTPRPINERKLSARMITGMFSVANTTTGPSTFGTM